MIRKRSSIVPDRLVASLLALVPVVACAACSGRGSPVGATDSKLSSTVDQTGIDVQVLQVWIPGRVLPQRADWDAPGPNDVSFNAADPSVCPTLTSSSNFGGAYQDRTVDCGAAFANAAPFDVTQQPGPLLDPIQFSVSTDVADNVSYLDPEHCNRVEVRIVARNAAVAAASFAGIGFSTSKGDSFTPASALQAVGNVTLKSGDPATVYRFAGISTCVSSHDSTSGNAYQTFGFKPYAAYDVANADGTTTRYRAWENIQGNFLLGTSWPDEEPVVSSTGFDRQSDLLAP